MSSELLMILYTYVNHKSICREFRADLKNIDIISQSAPCTQWWFTDSFIGVSYRI